MVEDAECLDDVGDSDAAVPNEQELLAVGSIRRRREIEAAHIDARGRLVEVDDDKLVVQA